MSKLTERILFLKFVRFLKYVKIREFQQFQKFVYDRTYRAPTFPAGQINRSWFPGDHIPCCERVMSLCQCLCRQRVSCAFVCFKFCSRTSLRIFAPLLNCSNGTFLRCQLGNGYVYRIHPNFQGVPGCARDSFSKMNTGLQIFIFYTSCTVRPRATAGRLGTWHWTGCRRTQRQADIARTQ